MSRTKKQHYIAQCLLKIFVDNEDIYECRIHSKKIYKTSFENSMCQSNSYEFFLLKDNFLEDFFAKNIDGDTAELNRKILYLLNQNDCKIEEVYKLFFSGIHLYLVNYYKSITSLIRLGKENSKTDNTSIFQMLSRILNKEYIKRLAYILNKGYKFSIIKAINGEFIMCDQYIATCSMKYKGRFTNISSRDIGVRDTIILFPINCYYYIAFYSDDIKIFELKEEKINVLSPEQVTKINEIIYNNAYEKVVSRVNNNFGSLEKKYSSYVDITTIMVYSNGKVITYKIKNEVFLTQGEYDFCNYYESMSWASKDFRNTKVNDKCPCGSEKKYKKCCKSKVDRCYLVMNNAQNNRNILIDDRLGVEEPVLMPYSKNQEMKKLFEKLRNDIHKKDDKEH